VIHKGLLALIPKTLRQCRRHAQPRIHLSQQQDAPIAGDRPTGKISRDFSRAEVSKK